MKNRKLNAKLIALNMQEPKSRSTPGFDLAALVVLVGLAVLTWLAFGVIGHP